MLGNIARKPFMLFILLLVALAPARAHEYWIDPQDPVAPVHAPLRADARVGQFFIGDALPWLPDAVAGIGVADALGTRRLEPVIGDMPMFDATPREAGLHILFLETKPETLTWETAEKFLAFLDEKKLRGVLAEHRRRGLPEAGFREQYVRHAKALLLRGAPRGETDRALGLRLELVALDDPFRVRANGVLRVRLLWRGSPLPDTDVQLFSRPSGQRDVEARPRHMRTDAQGIARLPVEAGRDYLVNAVIMRPQPVEQGAPWISHWASLTFTIPEPR